MSRLFDDAASQFLEMDVAPASVYPLTLACWMYPDDAANNTVAMWVGDKDVNADWLALIEASGGEVGDPFRAAVNDSGFSAAVTSTGYTANTWHHCCGVFTSTTSRDAFIDGGSKGSNAVARAPSGADRTSIGRIGRLVPFAYFSGRIAEAGIWDVALTDDEVKMLAAGISPIRVRPLSLVEYWPIYGVDSPEKDYSKNNNDMVVTGATQADHAPVALPFGFDLGWGGAPSPLVVPQGRTKGVTNRRMATILAAAQRDDPDGNPTEEYLLLRGDQFGRTRVTP